MALSEAKAGGVTTISDFYFLINSPTFTSLFTLVSRSIKTHYYYSIQRQKQEFFQLHIFITITTNLLHKGSTIHCFEYLLFTFVHNTYKNLLFCPHQKVSIIFDLSSHFLHHHTHIFWNFRKPKICRHFGKHDQILKC